VRATKIDGASNVRPHALLAVMRPWRHLPPSRLTQRTGAQSDSTRKGRASRQSAIAGTRRDLTPMTALPRHAPNSSVDGA
jgi:hypothetical protein